MLTIEFSITLSVIQYVIFFFFLIGSVYYLYQRLTTQEERNVYRLKLQKEVEERKDKLVNKQLETPFQSKFEQTNIKFINAFNFQVIRLLIILVTGYYYVLIPFLDGESTRLPLILLVIFVALTEPLFKFSLINVLLNSLIKKRQKAKIIEMFTLFDILKAELYTLRNDQEVNIYNSLKNVLPMFNHIQGTLSKFLSSWKRSPTLAKDIFHDEIGGESAKTLGDILYKLDSVSKQEALDIIESESDLFSVQYYQKELQQSGKESTAYFSFFLLTNILIIVWLIVFVFIMFNDRMNDSNLFL